MYSRIISLTNVLKMKETPSQLPIQSFVMNFPFTLSTSDPNNIWMQELSDEDLTINKPKAYKQFMDLYNFVSGQTLTYLLPAEGNFQDQVYVANLGLQLPHLKDRNVVLLSNYTSDPRKGEELVGEKFFNMMGYETFISPYKWEGEADIKYLYDNVYIGGYGIRSNIKTYEWMEKNFDMNIIKVAMTDEYLYHLDCSIFPLNGDQTLVATELFDDSELREIEKYTEIIPIDTDDALCGITNSVRMGNMILCASNISEMKKTDEYYEMEKHKIASLEKICSNAGMEPVIFNLSEYMKSGAMLSCMMMHLNRVDHNKTLL
jgi:N-dimethylarginine dimethylaminohydrolase